MFTLRVTNVNESYQISGEEAVKYTLLELLNDRGFKVPAVCAGRGVCGKCKITVKSGELPVTTHDRDIFAEEQLMRGERLACVAHMSGDLEIEVDDEKDLQVLTMYSAHAQAHINTGFTLHSFDMRGSYRDMVDVLADKCPNHTLSLSVIKKLPHMIDKDGELQALCSNNKVVDVFEATATNPVGVAIDIGTTTLGFEMFDLITGKRRAIYSAVNSQRRYGADVISRIKSTSEGSLAELNKTILTDLADGLYAIAKKANVNPIEIYKIVISGNTTMLHLLLNVQCKSLGLFPFTPVFTNMVRTYSSELFKSIEAEKTSAFNFEVIVLPGVSAYVGSDITAGMLFCGGLDAGKPSLLIDLGTNGEIMLFGPDIALCTSTAAGPAFEGGNIEHGMAGVPGAITKVRYENSKFIIETIDGEKPIGICGSGVISLVAALIENGIIDETGLIDDEVFDDDIPLTEGGSVTFSQKDVRELQLAKSAVRAGIEILIAEAGLTFADIEHVFIAGGFGFAVDMDSAAAIGLVPDGMKEKVVALGNSSLGGAAAVLLDCDNEDNISRIASAAREINLSSHKDFNTKFMEYMYF